jgi:hypothetical protein
MYTCICMYGSGQALYTYVRVGGDGVRPGFIHVHVHVYVRMGGDEVRSGFNVQSSSMY